MKLFEKQSDFEISEQAQLPEGQPAVYNLSRDILVAPIEVMKSSGALTREVAYLLLGSRLETTPPWLAAALTEYLSSAPFKGTYLDLQDPFQNMLAHLDTAYGLANKNIPMLKPSQVLTTNYNQFRDTGLEGNKARSSALLTYYFFTFLDDKGKPMDGYLRALKTNTDPNEAMAILANDRDEDQLADALRVAYITKQLRVRLHQIGFCSNLHVLCERKHGSGRQECGADLTFFCSSAPHDRRDRTEILPFVFGVRLALLSI